MNGQARSRVLSGVFFLLIVVFIRGGFLVARSDGLRDDPDAYRVIAETLSITGVYGLPMAQTLPGGEAIARPTAFRPPLYPWLLSWMVGSDGKLDNMPVAVLQWLIGIVTVVLTWDIARRLLSRGAALVAAALVLIDPILLWQSTLVMTETIATLLVMMAWWWWVVRIGRAATPCVTLCIDAMVLGCLLLLAILCRPTFIVWAAMLVAVMLAVAILLPARAGRVCRSAMVVITVTVFASGVGAWTFRNVAAVGRPVWGTTHGGYTLLLANNDSFYDYLQEKKWQLPWQNTAWEPSDFFAQYQSLPRSGDECSDDDVAYATAKSTIARRPGMFWYSCAARLARLWQPFPHATADRSAGSIFVVGSFHSIVYLLVLIAAVRHRHALRPRCWRKWIPLWPALAVVVTLSGVHAVYWSNPRMRSPAIPAIAIAAAASLVPRDRFDRVGTETDERMGPLS